jgi:hypothetical protein
MVNARMTLTITVVPAREERLSARAAARRTVQSEKGGWLALKSSAATPGIGTAK